MHRILAANFVFCIAGVRKVEYTWFKALHPLQRRKKQKPRQAFKAPVSKVSKLYSFQSALVLLHGTELKSDDTFDLMLLNMAPNLN